MSPRAGVGIVLGVAGDEDAEGVDTGAEGSLVSIDAEAAAAASKSSLA